MTDTERREWMVVRRRGIGASDAAAVCGLSPWTTALEAYLRKTGELPDAKPTPAMEWGLRLEPAISQAYMDARPGIGLTQPRQIWWHRQLDWMLATLDRVSSDGRVVELKSAHQFTADHWGEPGTDEIPEHYLIQVQHQLAVAGSVEPSIDVADVPVLIGGSDFRVYTVHRDQRIIDHLIGIESEFWRRVQLKRPPEPDFAHRSTRDLIASLYGVDPEQTVTLGDQEMELVREYEEWGVDMREAGIKRDVAKSQLLYAMGAAGMAYLPDGRRMTRKTVERKAYSVEATSYTDFRILKGRAK